MSPAASAGAALAEAIPMEPLRLADWSGFTDFGGTAEVFAPRSEEEVSRLVRACYEEGRKLRAVGRRTAWNSLWYCRDAMMSTAQLNAIQEIDPDRRTVICQPGVMLADLHRALWQHGLCLPTAPAVDWVSVGGAISTGSHGSGFASISSSMVGCRLVTGTGEVLQIDEADRQLDAVRISLGLLGVLSSVTLQLVDAFEVSVQRARIPSADWRRFLSEGAMSYLLWFPHTGFSVLNRAEIVSGPPAAPGERIDPSRARAAPSLELQPSRTTTDGVDLGKYARAVSELAQYVPSTFPARNRYLLDVFFADRESRGPAHEMLMSFQSDPIAGTEWAVPVEEFEGAFAELQRITEQGELYLPIVWLKKVRGETAWLAAAEEDCIQCGIYHDVIPGAPSHVEQMVSRVSEIFLRHGGRPHLSKLIPLGPAEIKRAYRNWAAFDELRRRMDPENVFWSEAIQKLLGA